MGTRSRYTTWGRIQSGFTIVELLIVIVVIGILTSVTVVSFNGVQQRSKSAVIDSAVNAWVKHVELRIAEGGTFPASGVTCLGKSATDFPATADFAAGECLKDWFDDPDYYPPTSESYDATLTNTIALGGNQPLPNGLIPAVQAKATDGSGYNRHMRGVVATFHQFSTIRWIRLQWMPGTPGACVKGTYSNPNCSWLRNY